MGNYSNAPLADLENDNEYTGEDALRFRRLLSIANNQLTKRDATICELTSKVKQLEEKEKRYLKLLRALGEWQNETADKATELKLEQILNEK